MILPGRMSAQVHLVLTLFCIAIYIGAIQHVDNRVHDDLLQIHSCCCFLAMVQPEFQRTCQLHKQALISHQTCFTNKYKYVMHQASFPSGRVMLTFPSPPWAPPMLRPLEELSPRHLVLTQR